MDDIKRSPLVTTTQPKATTVHMLGNQGSDVNVPFYFGKKQFL